VDNATQRTRKRKAEGEPDLNANNTRELKKGAIVACWADPSSGDVYWLARVIRGYQGKPKASSTSAVRIRWFEQLKRKNYYREGQEDDLAIDTIFHILSTDGFIATKGLWRLEEDLSVYGQ